MSTRSVPVDKGDQVAPPSRVPARAPPSPASQPCLPPASTAIDVKTPLTSGRRRNALRSTGRRHQSRRLGSARVTGVAAFTGPGGCHSATAVASEHQTTAIHSQARPPRRWVAGEPGEGACMAGGKWATWPYIPRHAGAHHQSV
ncbi:hypothetical protein ACQ859_14995 [Roseateles chitinivorans]|uniref:hypothetical protein n=1 Tax=Roseateles chitinivorans TaxID=2917965 RepID=UPI003D67EF34